MRPEEGAERGAGGGASGVRGGSGWSGSAPEPPSCFLRAATRDIVSTATCNECHDALVFHGRRYAVEYCVQCHNADDEDIPDGGNWSESPNMQACGGCHNVFGDNATGMHRGGAVTDNWLCTMCHPVEIIGGYHVMPNSTPNNLLLPDGQRDISYEMVSAPVDGKTNDVTDEFRLMSEDTAIDPTNLPTDLTDGMGAALRYPGLLLAYARPQDGIKKPAD